MFSATDTTKKFDAFAEEHESLERSLASLRDLLVQHQDAEAAIDACETLAVHVRTHFVHEVEEDGFFANVIEQAPRLKARANDLIREHVAIGAALSELQTYATNNPPSETWWRELNARAETFWELFCDHEQAEIDLIQDAFCDDLGVAD